MSDENIYTDIWDTSPAAIGDRKLKSIIISQQWGSAWSDSEECPEVGQVQWFAGDKLEWSYPSGIDMSSCLKWNIDGAGTSLYYHLSGGSGNWEPSGQVTVMSLEIVDGGVGGGDLVSVIGTDDFNFPFLLVNAQLEQCQQDYYQYCSPTPMGEQYLRQLPHAEA